MALGNCGQLVTRSAFITSSQQKRHVIRKNQRPHSVLFFVQERPKTLQIGRTNPTPISTLWTESGERFLRESRFQHQIVNF
jgi:hypothetical protein